MPESWRMLAMPENASCFGAVAFLQGVIAVLTWKDVQAQPAGKIAGFVRSFAARQELAGAVMFVTGKDASINTVARIIEMAAGISFKCVLSERLFRPLYRAGFLRPRGRVRHQHHRRYEG